MLIRFRQRLLTAMLASLSLWSAVASLSLWSTAVDAQIFNMNNRATPRITIRVGSGGNNVNQVSFTVPANQVGNNTSITDPTAIRIVARIQATAANPLTGSLTIDSFTNPLTNNSPSSNATIPFSEISWTARDGDIPSGFYQEMVNQPLVSFQSSQRYRDFHTFSYANTGVIESGTYEGRVTYTWAVP